MYQNQEKAKMKTAQSNPRVLTEYSLHLVIYREKLYISSKKLIYNI